MVATVSLCLLSVGITHLRYSDSDGETAYVTRWSDHLTTIHDSISMDAQGQEKLGYPWMSCPLKPAHVTIVLTSCNEKDLRFYRESVRKNTSKNKILQSAEYSSFFVFKLSSLNIYLVGRKFNLRWTIRHVCCFQFKKLNEIPHLIYFRYSRLQIFSVSGFHKLYDKLW